jgi:hypothetical protein
MLGYQVTFSKPMKASNLSADDFSLKGNLLTASYSATSFAFNAAGTVLTLNYANLPEDNYTLTLLSGATGGTNFTDQVGNALDGEFSGTFPSGDGFAGGNFVSGFTLDIGTIPFPTPLTPKLPLGSLIYDRTVTGSIGPAGDSDSFTLAVDAGQTLSVLVTPTTSGLTPVVELRDPANALLGSATAAAAGNKVVLQTLPVASSGTYTLTISGASGTIGGYTVGLTLNAALESETLGGPTNDTLATAQNLDSSAVSLGGSATRLAVLGTIGAGPVGAGEDFESGILPPSFTTYASNSFGRIQITVPNGTGNSSKFAMLMDSTGNGSYVLNEAIYHVNLSGLTQANLGFAHIQFSDESDSLPTDFTGHANGDGVAISDDGNRWHTILNAPANSTWTTANIDLAAAAAAAGMTLGANFQIKFQQYDNYEY